MTPAQISDRIYCLACQYDLKEKAVRELCQIAGVSYPPVQLEVV